MVARTLFLGAFALILRLDDVHGHAKLVEPPARNAMWRFGYDTPEDLDDAGLYCGGFSTQWKKNGGRCGPCGDAFSHPTPRPHETGGLYGKNITVRTYPPDADVDVVVDITSNHMGWFQFSLCQRDSVNQLETEDCFHYHLPILTEEGAVYRYVLPTSRGGLYLFKVKLPRDVTCNHCILRWEWIAGHTVGRCKDGKQRLGCGPQETYRNCADIAIRSGGGVRGPLAANGLEK
ncbi:uncharacterized protein LOC135396890 [Ornithodoros turicata]|uniref:uncharacterized protein LOC135396890 n=1 Tax=Ornithodoros turicata TaxID=34597 RepID=UPI00313924D5